ncbi:glycosyltransferase family 9 protein [methanotrophic endosymbiont of Bathymodiolus puteoserpentis (Logatchev)]|jgi:heptosyltransferase I|uniref:glycosyltransferase family 9 protein n=1 Tax=methanotrophic endosymbiont of Bathymodiolus puteoserpentis (Logatchev) TaxID=343235 RepID=UPI00157B724D|nr:glycosyltransferase family 9 protein [methanotrophic endosymbiont of Bathymodiolus puteoserpentis (Logatchev)]
MSRASLPNKITILRLSAIGDVLMLLPAVRLLKRQFPDTQIDWLIDRPIASLISEVSEVNVVAIDKPKSLSDYWQLKKQWRHKNTGQLISFQTSFVSNIVMALLPADHKTGFGSPYSREGHHLFTDTTYDLPPKLHQVEIFFALAKAFSGVTEDIKISTDDLALPIASKDKVWADEKLRSYAHWIAINPMASTQEKTGSAEFYINLINKLNKRYPEYQLVLTGGPSTKEVKFGAEIQSQLASPCLNLIGQTSLKQLAAILEHVKLLISPDTGPLHLANAVATSVVGLYAVTRPEYIGPYNQLQNCINIYARSAQQFMHKPAEQLPWQKKIPSLEAIQLISVEQVLNKVHTFNL